jgi:hypothetical protein
VHFEQQQGTECNPDHHIGRVLLGIFLLISLDVSVDLDNNHSDLTVGQSVA